MADVNYIHPNSTIQLFFNVDLAPDNENTYYFASESAKNNYFTSLPGSLVFSQQYYTRKSRNSVRLNTTMNTVFKANYMRFKNTSVVNDATTGQQFENKWFYAFITNVEYINNGCVEITYQIDVLMTWMGNFTLKECFIERQHSTTDVIGDNIVEEGLETGEYITSSVGKMGATASNVTETAKHFNVCVATTVQQKVVTDDPIDYEDRDQKYEPATGGYYGGIYSGVQYRYFDEAHIADLNTFLDDLTTDAKSDSIVSITMSPKGFEHGKNLPSTGNPKTLNAIYKPTSSSSIDGYTPKNNKLHTYPYCFFQVTNNEGEYVDFRYEFFNSADECRFKAYGVSSIASSVGIFPLNYGGMHSSVSDGSTVMTEDESMGIYINSFPVCTWNIDAWKAWYAQNKNTIQTKFMQDVGNTIMSAGLMMSGMPSTYMPTPTSTLPSTIVTGGVQQPFLAQQQGNTNAVIGGYMGTISGLQSIARSLAQMKDYTRKPATANGKIDGDLTFTLGRKDFYYIKRNIKKSYVERIDKFFTMYGYAQKTVGRPKMKVRSRFTYLKTVGCIVSGNIPANDARMIESAIDNGVRFWNTPMSFGDYTLDNTILNSTEWG